MKNENKKSRKQLLAPAQHGSYLDDLFDLTKELLPKYGGAWNRHSLVTLDVTAQARLLYYNELYQKITAVPGVICEFGVHWGATMTQLINLRSIYEPFNHSRHIYGFDTFEGFPDVHEKDGGVSRPGDLKTLVSYEEKLEQILTAIEAFSPLSHMKKYSLIKGDAGETINDWLDEHPHALISMAILDMDLYEPTKKVLEKIIPRLTKGSMIVFDELNCSAFPGETRALDEVFGLNNVKLYRSKFQPYCAYMIYGE